MALAVCVWKRNYEKTAQVCRTPVVEWHRVRLESKAAQTGDLVSGDVENTVQRPKPISGLGGIWLTLFTLLSFFYRVSVVFASFFSWRGLFFFLRRDNGCRFFSQIVTKCLMALRIESWGQISRRENVGRNQKWYNAQRRGHTKEEDGRNIFFDPPPRIMKIKTKIIKWDLVKLKSFCTAKETIMKMKRRTTHKKKKRKEKTSHRTGDNICKWSNRQGINLQNIQTACVALKKVCVCFKKKQTTQSKKWAEKSK